VVLIEKVREDGSVARIIFSGADSVDVNELGQLCEKVKQVLLVLHVSQVMRRERSFTSRRGHADVLVQALLWLGVTALRRYLSTLI
jgi:hypothetical protein